MRANRSLVLPKNVSGFVGYSLNVQCCSVYIGLHSCNNVKVGRRCLTYRYHMTQAALLTSVRCASSHYQLLTYTTIWIFMTVVTTFSFTTVGLFYNREYCMFVGTAWFNRKHVIQNKKPGWIIHAFEMGWTIIIRLLFFMLFEFPKISSDVEQSVMLFNVLTERGILLFLHKTHNN